MNRSLVWWSLAAIAAATTLLSAQSPLMVRDAWVREPLPRASTTAAYAVIENPSATDAVLVDVSSTSAKAAELHEMVMAGDMMDMRRVKEIRVPAAGRVELKPGGLHVMLFELTHQLKDGDVVPLTFTTNDGWTIRAHASVRKRGAGR